MHKHNDTTARPRLTAVLLFMAFGVLMAAFAAFLPTDELTAAPKTVYVLLSSDSNIYEEGLTGLRSVLKEEIRFDYLNIIRAEKPDPAAYFQKIDNEALAVVAFGPQAAEAAGKNFRRAPVIFSMLNNPKSILHHLRELCGVSMDMPIGEYFSALKELSPRARRVHAFYSTDAGAFLAGEGEYADLKHGLIYTKERIANPEKFTEALEAKKGKIDAFYMIPDPLFNQQRFGILSEWCRKNGVTLMTSFRSLVRLGASFGWSPDYGKIGVLTGQLTERITSGRSSCASEGIMLPDRSSFFFYFNEKYVRSSGMPPPQSLLERARLVNLLQIAVRLTSEGKYNTAQTIFQKILTNDPNNTTAQYYLDFILNRLTGEKIALLMREAEESVAREDFPKAREAYQKALAINPKLKEAQEGAARTLFLQSESERKQANALFSGGRAFDAIRMAQVALDTLPTNDRAQQDLQRMRMSQHAVIPTLFGQGLKSYNIRDYEAAEKDFANILLVEPHHAQAAEYLRLSKLKKDAMRRLREKLKRIKTDK